ncbi:uncharacterized protein LOC125047457 [Penaeus chinensis]|uniref:uncharacterized protein LOC125047457 n=1 Tax=Penaeus chinensis TaxID=139456 RepID=UPI001FB6C69C|nr:uncharacterized protein LOC125047457 [Penaeus chinensis]
MDTLTESIRKEAPWYIMFADDVVLCCEENIELEEDLERWRDRLEKRGMKVSRAKTEYMCLNGVSKRKYMDARPITARIQSDGGVEAEISRRIQSGWNNWKKMAGVMCDKRVPARVKGKIHRTVIQSAMLYGLETVPQTKATRRLEVAEMKMCRWAYGLTMGDRMRNDEEGFRI